ncbi:MAG: ABC transporter ATP-binding protein, partial [Acidimicrobiia bacterium]|nr:ABC transporter ATP-binding protein [Acidimicrobiia bacterium]
MPAVEVEGVTVRYGDLVALDDVSISADRGEVLAVLGPNGAGKTTLVEAIEGYVRPERGSVRVLGLDPLADATSLRARLGVMPQSSRLYAAIRPAEAVRLFASYYPHNDDPGAVLARVGLAGRAHTAWRRLSGGEQQRLSLALALVGRPEVLILDEPTAGLDLDGRHLVRRLIADIAAGGAAVVVTTHELDEVERIADRVTIIDKGHVVASAPLDELRASGSERIRFRSEADLDMDELIERLGAPVTVLAAGYYEAAVAPSPANVALLAGWLAERNASLGDLETGERRLEEVFAQLTAQPSADPTGADPT